MKVKNKPLKRKIVVTLLGMCVAVSSYTIPSAHASPSQQQIAADTPATATAQSAPAAPPQSPFDYGYSYYGYGYGYYGYGYNYNGYSYMGGPQV